MARRRQENGTEKSSHRLAASKWLAMVSAAWKQSCAKLNLPQQIWSYASWRNRKAKISWLAYVSQPVNQGVQNVTVRLLPLWYHLIHQLWCAVPHGLDGLKTGKCQVRSDQVRPNVATEGNGNQHWKSVSKLGEHADAFGGWQCEIFLKICIIAPDKTF